LTLSKISKELRKSFIKKTLKSRRKKKEKAEKEGKLQ
jgi:hypothetical protein